MLRLVKVESHAFLVQSICFVLIIPLNAISLAFKEN